MKKLLIPAMLVLGLTAACSGQPVRECGYNEIMLINGVCEDTKDDKAFVKTVVERSYETPEASEGDQGGDDNGQGNADDNGGNPCGGNCGVGKGNGGGNGTGNEGNGKGPNKK